MQSLVKAGFGNGHLCFSFSPAAQTDSEGGRLAFCLCFWCTEAEARGAGSVCFTGAIFPFRPPKESANNLLFLGRCIICSLWSMLRNSSTEAYNSLDMPICSKVTSYTLEMLEAGQRKKLVFLLEGLRTFGCSCWLNDQNCR